jgi:hypothetical protein
VRFAGKPSKRGRGSTPSSHLLPHADFAATIGPSEGAPAWASVPLCHQTSDQSSWMVWQPVV